MGDITQLGLIIAGVMLILTLLFRQWFPQELGYHIEKYFQKLISYVYPYSTITFYENQVEDFQRNVAIERYLSARFSNGAKQLTANVARDGKLVFLSMGDSEQVTDEFNGIKIWWSWSKKCLDLLTSDDVEKRYFKLTCHRQHRDVITKHYLHHVIDEGKTIAAKTRQRKLYTNNKRGYWSHILFEHPCTFDTLAMDPEKKKDILDDLMMFCKSKDSYKKVGKSWKRGYLLYGPPGSGKSSLIAAMANFLEYDIYDLDLNSVGDNTDLGRLLVTTSSKSIIVIEDIDCSLNQWKAKKDNTNGEKKNKKGSEVTLSGLLNFIDGLWSACGGERLIVFTTNNIEKLDPALIRRGRMDKYIELSYCCYESFKVLAKNYLDLYSHNLFATIRRLLEEINMTPADVAENLMPSLSEENAEACLNNLIKSLENAKEQARLKGSEDYARIKVEEEEHVKRYK